MFVMFPFFHLKIVPYTLLINLFETSGILFKDCNRILKKTYKCWWHCQSDGDWLIGLDFKKDYMFIFFLSNMLSKHIGKGFSDLLLWL